AAGAVRGHPTYALAFALFDERSWAALGSGRPLQRYRLIAAEPDDFVLRAPLRIDEVVFSYLLDGTAADARGRDLGQPAPRPTFIRPAHQRIAEWVAAQWQVGTPTGVVQLACEDTTAPSAIAARACEIQGVNLALIRSADVPAAASERAGLARLWEREHA